jgi:hypothetical protein
MTQARHLLCVALVCLTACAQLWAEDIARGPSQETRFETEQPRHETRRIRIENRAGGSIQISPDAGQSWRTIGEVVRPALQVNPAGYTASRWAEDSAIAATAVNALHIKIAANPQTGRGIIFSIIPALSAIGAAEGHPSASIQTDISGGTGIFGGYGPYVNSPVYLAQGDSLSRLPSDYVPSEGDVICIIRLEPEQRPLYCTFENRFGGRIELHYRNQEARLIGQVLRPVVGIGRFEGGLYAAPGRLRANHCGVVDISTSPLGQIGGFQIVPREHAASPEVGYIRENTQWMVVGPCDVRDPSWEGVAPLFSSYLAPSYRPDDITGIHNDWMKRTLSRLMVQVRFDHGEWENMPWIVLDPQAESDNAHNSRRGRVHLWHIPASLNPSTPLTATAATALRDVSHLRICFPMADYWPHAP